VAVVAAEERTRDAAARGAVVATRTRCVAAVREGGHWVLTLDGPVGRATVLAQCACYV
jgi:glycerol-3-phosphate dehydrogenase